MTSKTKQMIALMEAFDAVNSANKASQSLNESTQVELDEVSLPFHARTGRAIRGDAFETTVNVLVNSYEGERGDAAAIEAHLDANVEDAIEKYMTGRGGRSNEKPSAADIRAVRRHVMYDLGVDPDGAFSGKVKGTASNKPRMQDANRLYDAYVRINADDRGEVEAYLQGPVVAYAEKYGLNVRKLQKMTKRAIEQGGYYDSFDEFLKDVLGENTAAELDEMFGMPGKRSDRQADTMYALAMDYKDKFGFETFPVGDHMSEWLASVADEMKSEGITPAQLRVYLTAAYTFAKGGS